MLISFKLLISFIKVKINLTTSLLKSHLSSFICLPSFHYLPSFCISLLLSNHLSIICIFYYPNYFLFFLSLLLYNHLSIYIFFFPTYFPFSVLFTNYHYCMSEVFYSYVALWFRTFYIQTWDDVIDDECLKVYACILLRVIWEEKNMWGYITWWN